MRKTVSVLLLALCTICLTLQVSCAQSESPQTAKGRDNAGKLSPEEVLRQMPDYFAGLKAFSFRAETKVEVKATDMDQSSVTKNTVRVQRPNQMASIIDEGNMGMTVVSDGKQLFQFLPTMNRYSVQEAPASIAGISDTTGAGGIGLIGIASIAVPASPEEFEELKSSITESKYVGTEKVGDVECHHLHFDQESYGWDIWIQLGERPLVHKIVLDLSKRMKQMARGGEPSKIDYSILFTEWNIEPKFSDADFAFTPPAGAEKVESIFEGLAGGEDEGPHPLLGQPAPPFKTVGLDENPIDLSAHLGKSVVMLDFWATWCGPCVEALPQIDAVAKKLAERGLVFYAVNCGEDAETIQEFLKASEFDVPVAMDVDGDVSQLYGADAIPQTVLIGKDGKVQVVHVGFSGNLGEELTKEIEDLLAGKDLATEALAHAQSNDERENEADTVEVDPSDESQ